MKTERWYLEGKRLGMIQEAKLSLLDTRPIKADLMSATYEADRWWRVTNALHDTVFEMYKMMVAPFRTRGTRAELVVKLTRQSAEWRARIGPRDNLLPPEAVSAKGIEEAERAHRRQASAVRSSNKARAGRTGGGGFGDAENS
jgi:hypothetical protein